MPGATPPAGVTRAAARRPSVELAAALLLVAGLVALGLYGLVFQATLSRRLPAPADWTVAAATLAREARPGDAVALDPWWAERAREIVPPGVPVLARPTLDGDELLGLRRVWLLALPRAPGRSPRIQRDVAARAGAAGPLARAGAISLVPYPLRAPVLPLAYLPARLAAASVAANGAACAGDAGGGFRCPGRAGGVRVALEIREVGDAPRRCVRVAPPPGVAPNVTLAFEGVEMGRALRVHAGGLPEPAPQAEVPARLGVTIEGKAIGALDDATGPGAWRAVTLDTHAFAGAAHRVSFTFTSQEAGAGELCFDAYTLP